MRPTRPITVLIADDHPIFRRGLCDIIAADASLRLVGEAADGEQAWQLIQKLQPAVAVLDIHMPKRSGIQLGRLLLQQRLRVELIILTMDAEEALLNEALNLGVKGYLLKETAVTDLLQAIHRVAIGDSYISPALSGALLRRNAACEGTRITSLAPHCNSPFKSIAVKKKLSIIDVVASRMLMTHGYMKSIFDIFDKHQCPVDMVCTSEVSVSLTVDSNEKLPAVAADLGRLADVKYEGKKALLCLVGDDIRGHSGIAAQVFTAMRNINVRMISQGASEINMSFMIEEDDADEAVRLLHAAFFKNPDPTIFDVAARK